jgi:hypothetical protein
VRETYNRSVDETEMEVLRPVLEADVLVLDDLGVEKTSEWVQETLGLVINTRYNARRATIVTSNLRDPLDNTDMNSFMVQLGGRSRSRLLEMCEWVEVQGADIRDVDRITNAPRPARCPKRRNASRKRTCRARAGHGSRSIEGCGRSIRAKLVGWESRQ